MPGELSVAGDILLFGFGGEISKYQNTNTVFALGLPEGIDATGTREGAISLVQEGIIFPLMVWITKGG